MRNLREEAGVMRMSLNVCKEHPTCFICYQGGPFLVRTPCACIGTMGHTHSRCIRSARLADPRLNCPVCRSFYSTPMPGDGAATTAMMAAAAAVGLGAAALEAAGFIGMRALGVVTVCLAAAAVLAMGGRRLIAFCM